MTKLKLTLDANAIINHFDTDSTSATSRAALTEIMRRWNAGDIDLAITTRIEADLLQDKNEGRRDEMLAKIGLLPIVGTDFRLDVSKLDGLDMILGDDQDAFGGKIKDLLFPRGIDYGSQAFPNKINDVDHLVGHRWAERDIFVTDDNQIIKKAKYLASLSITVMRPADAINEIERLLALISPP